jgi:hypothetical protein
VGKVFGADQATDTIYEETVQPLLPYVWEGNIGTLFAYGQTGSGKTFTVSGIERLIAKSLFNESLAGERKVHVCIFELAGNSALGKTRTPQYSHKLTKWDTHRSPKLSSSIHDSRGLLW